MLCIFNVRELIFYERVDNVTDLRFTKILTSHPWSRSIKRITEASSHLFTDCIFKGGLCPLLTEITISGQDKSLGSEFIDLLGNAPELRDLTLRKFSFTIADLESLHGKVVWLPSLSLNNVKVCPVSSSLYYSYENENGSITDATPAMAMTKLVLDDKYPAITDMVYSVNIDNNDVREGCINSGLAPQIEQIGRHLVSLTCGKSNLFPYVFPLLDKSNCRLQKLVTCTTTSHPVIQGIVNSKQAQSLQTLPLCCHFDKALISQLAKFPVLTKLHLVYDSSNNGSRGEFDINQLVDTIGNTIVDIELANIDIKLKHLPVSSCPSLKTLRLRSCTLPKHVDIFIRYAFPNLRTLIINQCIWAMSAFHLTSLNLSYIELRDSMDTEYVLVETLCNNEKRWYTAHLMSKSNPHPTGDPCNFPAVKSLPFSKYSSNIPAAVFVCNSLNSFFFVYTER